MKLEREEDERLGAMQKMARQKARSELEGKDYLELEELPVAMASYVQVPQMKEGRVAQERFKIAKERRKLGFREERPVEDLVLPKVGLAKISGVKSEPLRERVAKKEFGDVGIEVVDIPEDD
jgi:hypothetical protein